MSPSRGSSSSEHREHVYEAEEASSLLENRTQSQDVGASAERARIVRGFLLLSAASEVYVIAGATLFVPILLETFARENGRLAPDYTSVCQISSQVEDGAEPARCAVRLFGGLIDTASFSLYVYSASVTLQALTVISIGGLADDPKARHRLLSGFSALGAGSCITFLALSSSSVLWPLCALLAAVANVCCGASIVCLNSYLPFIGQSSALVQSLHAELVAARSQLAATQLSDGESRLSASQAVMRATDDYDTARSAATAQVSSRGIALGYAAGIIALAGMLVPVSLLGSGSSWSLRCAMAGTGLIWGIGSLPALVLLRPAHEPPKGTWREQKSVMSHVAEGWRALGDMLKEWRRLPITFVFLAAWVFLSEAFSTTTSTAILFGKTTLGMSTTGLIAVALLTPLAGMGGALLFPRLQHSVLKLSNMKMVVFLVSCSTIVPLWGLIALRSAWQIYLLAVVFGALYGSFQAFARSCFSELIPHVQSSRWFGLYSITDKSSSFLGPLLVAAVTQVTGEIRVGFWVILSMLVLALPILSAVNMQRGRADAESMQRSLLAAEAEQVGDDV